MGRRLTRKQADVAERLGTLRQLGGFAGAEVAGTGGDTGPVLAEKRDYDLVEGYCSPAFARSFKLYGRAAAFAAYAEEARGWGAAPVQGRGDSVLPGL